MEGRRGNKQVKDQYKFSKQRNKAKEEMNTEMWREKTTRELDELYENFLAQINSPKYDRNLLEVMTNEGNDEGNESVDSNRYTPNDEGHETAQDSREIERPLFEDSVDDLDNTRKNDDEDNSDFNDMEPIETEEKDVGVGDLDHHEEEIPRPKYPDHSKDHSIEEKEEDELNNSISSIGYRDDVVYDEPKQKPEIYFLNNQQFSEKWDEVGNLLRMARHSGESETTTSKMSKLMEMKEKIEKKFMVLKIIEHVTRVELRSYEEKVRDIQDYGKKLGFGSDFLNELSNILERLK